MDEIKRFLMTIKDNPVMLENVKNIGTDQLELMRYANSLGYAFTLEELEIYLKSNVELSLESLDSVSGGAVVSALFTILF